MNYKMVFHIIGRILLVEALLLAVPLAVSLIYREDILLAYVLPILLLIATGLVLGYKQPKNSAIYAKEGFFVVSLSWIVISLFGALPFWLSGAIPSYLDSFFETVSGFTTTGASILAEVESLPMSLLFWRSFTHWVGGMGILVFVLAILPKVETSSIYLMKAEVPGPQVGKLVSKTKLTARILYGIYIILTLIQILFLLAGGMPLFDSITNAFATAGTGGFSIKNASIGAYHSAYIDWIITIFMILFGINFNLFYFVISGQLIAALKSEELRWYIGIIAGAALLIAGNILPLYGNIGEALRHSSFQVASIITTTGFATVDFNTWPTFSKGLLVLLMFLGACAGSTGGGLKISRVVMLVKSAVRELRHYLNPRSVMSVKFEHKTVDSAVIGGVHLYFVIYAILFVVSVFLMGLDQFDLITNFTSVASCINNVGPGLELVGPMGNYSAFSPLSKLLLSFDMLAGRLELIPMLILFSSKIWKKG